MVVFESEDAARAVAQMIESQMADEGVTLAGVEVREVVGERLAGRRSFRRVLTARVLLEPPDHAVADGDDDEARADRPP